ncbi:MAG: hypothetical protein H6550_08830 [Chitinophagales bacterium]|nr:hypothetical protein [Chitinophagales bacterium]
MKYFVKATMLLTLFAAFTLSLSSCKKDEDEGLLPQISFITDNGYTSKDANMATSTDFKIGIKAAKSEDKDVLTKFTITKSTDGGADNTVFTKDLSGDEANSYSYDYAGTTMDKAGNEKYTFTVVNRDGLINKASLVITVN